MSNKIIEYIEEYIDKKYKKGGRLNISLIKDGFILLKRKCDCEGIVEEIEFVIETIKNTVNIRNDHKIIWNVFVDFIKDRLVVIKGLKRKIGC